MIPCSESKSLQSLSNPQEHAWVKPGYEVACSVAVVSSVAVWSSHLSTNKMRFYFFQSKCVVIVSSPFDFPTRGGLQCEFCSFRFADPLEDLCMKQFRWVFGEFTEERSMFETFLGQGICSYVGELESMGQE